MPSGVRLFTPEQEAQILGEADLRQRFTLKAIARRWGLTEKQLSDLLERLRDEREENRQKNGSSL